MSPAYNLLSNGLDKKASIYHLQKNKMKHSAFLERLNNFIPSCPLTYIVEVSYLTQVQKRKKERGKDREIKRGRQKDMSPRISLAGWEPLNVPGWESSVDAYKL